jgi:hypothetical protein
VVSLKRMAMPLSGKEMLKKYKKAGWKVKKKK